MSAIVLSALADLQTEITTHNALVKTLIDKLDAAIAQSPASDDPQVLSTIAEMKSALTAEDAAINSALNPAPAAADTGSAATDQS